MENKAKFELRNQKPYQDDTFGAISLIKIDVKKLREAIEMKKPEDAIDVKKLREAIEMKKPEDAIDVKKLREAIEMKKTEEAFNMKKLREAVDMKGSKYRRHGSAKLWTMGEQDMMPGNDVMDENELTHLHVTEQVSQQDKKRNDESLFFEKKSWKFEIMAFFMMLLHAVYFILFFKYVLIDFKDFEEEVFVRITITTSVLILVIHTIMLIKLIIVKMELLLTYRVAVCMMFNTSVLLVAGSIVLLQALGIDSKSELIEESPKNPDKYFPSAVMFIFSLLSFAMSCLFLLQIKDKLRE